MTPDLSRRLAFALDLGGATPDERDLIVGAAQRAMTFEDLPPNVQALVLRLEQPPAPEPGDVEHQLHEVVKTDQPGRHHDDRIDHHKRPDYTTADLGLPDGALHTIRIDPQDVNSDRQHYQRDLDPDRVDEYRGEKRKKLAARWGLLARRPDGSLWVVNGQHHTQAAVDEQIPALNYRMFDSDGWEQEAAVYAAWERWHDQYKHHGS